MSSCINVCLSSYYPFGHIDPALAMFYFLALNSRSVFAGNDISVYPVTGIGFVLRDFSKVFSHTFRLDMAELTLRAVIK